MKCKCGSSKTGIKPIPRFPANLNSRSRDTSELEENREGKRISRYRWILTRMNAPEPQTSTHSIRRLGGFLPETHERR